MSFRRDSESEREWRRWVDAHQNELIAIGIPREVWADRLTWQRFIEHGYHATGPTPHDVRFRLEDLSDERQHRLYRFLDAALTESRGGNAVWLILDSRFGPADDHP